MMFWVSNVSNNAREISGSWEIFFNAVPTICGRIAAAFANSIAACCSPGAGDDVDLVCSILLDGGSHLPQPVHNFFFNLFDHANIAEMYLADINRAKAVTPVL